MLPESDPKIIDDLSRDLFDEFKSIEYQINGILLIVGIVCVSVLK
jgi:hypothetical protein